MSTASLIAERARQARASGASMLPSPCVSICRMDAASGLCEGCLRTLDEIARWGTLDDGARKQVWTLIEQRALAQQGSP
ncbi:MAG: DUF1289 domain-containing protein [Rubrivivax sp.]|nr:DUF1289 domain-containing protein [Rubrivivax sp.]